MLTAGSGLAMGTLGSPSHRPGVEPVSEYWYCRALCGECNVGRLAFAVRRAGTCYLLCLECGANYDQPVPSAENEAFDTPVEELMDPPRWATRQQVEARGWGQHIAGSDQATPLQG
jgi:hypothetical protein